MSKQKQRSKQLDWEDAMKLDHEILDILDQFNNLVSSPEEIKEDLDELYNKWQDKVDRKDFHESVSLQLSCVKDDPVMILENIEELEDMLGEME